MFIINKIFYSFLVISALIGCKEKNTSIVENNSLQSTNLSMAKTSVAPVESNLSTSEIKSDAEEVSIENLQGTWAINCENELTELSITHETGYLSLYSDNAIYIEVTIKKETNSQDFLMYFKDTASQKNFYKDKPNVVDHDISKDLAIGKISFKNDRLNLQWFGLYNTKNNKKEFLSDFLMIKENGGKNPIVLMKCN